MLRSAAKCVLRINKIANFYGFELCDAHPFNIAFSCDTPLFLDIGSFVPIRAPGAWVARQEFYECYLDSLAIAEKGYLGLFRHVFLLSGTSHEGEHGLIASPVASFLPVKLLRKIRRLRHIYHISRSIRCEAIQKRIPNRLLARLVYASLQSSLLPRRVMRHDRVMAKIDRYRLSQATAWASYHQKSNYYSDSGAIKLSSRFESILALVRSLGVSSVLELAGNQGVLSSAIAAIPGVHTVICTDYDPMAVDALHLRLSKESKAERNSGNLIYACFDFMKDVRELLTPERSNRLKVDLVIALAVTHHLLLGQNYSIDAILATMLLYSNRYLMIEFMPLGLWDGSAAPPLPSWYGQEWFESNLLRYGVILKVEQLEDNRVFYLLEKHPSIGA